jgi:hypothetical protein
MQSVERRRKTAVQRTAAAGGPGHVGRRGLGRVGGCARPEVEERLPQVGAGQHGEARDFAAASDFSLPCVL